MESSVIRYMLSWVEQNIYSEANISTLTNEIGYSRRTLEIWCLRHWNMTPGEYLSRRRMSRAAILLRMTTLPVAEISTLFHFYSQQNFSRAFRKKFGITPIKYRHQEEWKLPSLQKPLLIIDNKPLKSEIVFLDELKMYTQSVIQKHRFLLLTDNNEVIEKTQALISQFSENDKQDICFGYRVKPAKSLSAGREEMLQVEMLTQHPAKRAKCETVTIPAGMYMQFSFTGSWGEYVVFTRLIYFNIIENGGARRDGFDLTFFASPQGSGEAVTCRHLIPIV